MSTETTVAESATTEVKTNTAPAGETLEQKVARLEAEAAKSAEAFEKFRKFENEHKDAANAIKQHRTAAEKAAARAAELEAELLAEQNKRADLETKVRNRIVDSVLEKALVDAKAKAPSTALKLIDKAAVKVEGEDVDAKSVEALIKALKESDPILFDATETKEEVKTEIVHPKVKAATEGEVVGGYSKELAAAKSTAQIEAVMRKYGKLA